MSKCKTVQDENKIEKITVKTKDGSVEIQPRAIMTQERTDETPD
jgi:hypothetical protein